MSSAESQHPSSQWSQQQAHLLPPLHTQSSFPSPSTPSTSLSDHHYPPYYLSQSQQQSASENNLVDSRSSLSLNLSTLTVASPTNLSPIHPSVSPITPISPSNASLHQNSLAHHHHTLHPVQTPFQFVPPEHGVRYDDSQYDYSSGRRITSSRSSSSSEKSVPRKRSFTSGTSLPTSVEESAATPVSGTYDQSNNTMDTSPYDEVEMNYGGLDAENSPIDGSTSGGEQDEHMKPMDSQSGSGMMSSQTAGNGGGSSSGVIGKPMGTNNFVTKLYQMISDAKSAQFISWTELGTSFVVSNVGEFSRTILGSHFKHNNFSSFVRQLNMYGFHKINRTPRAQRTSADVQTWEFSHHKFLRGRPDLLEEIKRKALEPDPTLKHRVELPGEVAAQLGQMRDDNRRLAHALSNERAKVDRLVTVTKALYDVVSKAFPGHVPSQFPPDLLDGAESPNILVTSPTASTMQPHFSLGNPSMHSLHSLSPGSSPTAPEFPSHSHTPHSLSRQHSFQHVSDYGASMHGSQHSHPHMSRYEPAMSTPLPPSPGPLDAFEDTQGRKRQRTNPEDQGGKKGSRARSDSAPLGGYGLASGWPQTRPRSGSGLNSRSTTSRREELPVPNIGSLTRGHTLPTLSIPGVSKPPPN